MSAAAAGQSILLAELIDAILDDYISPCDSQDAIRGVLAEVDFDEPATLRTAASVLSRWRLGGEAA